MGVYVVLLGAPGVGKGTQAEMLSKETHLPHVSTGQLFREVTKASTPLGVEVQAYLGRGELVPDALTVAMVRERLSQPDCARGAILDGFPRTLEQARALDDLLSERGECVTVVPYISSRTETLLERLGGRWTCRNCQAVYHVVHNPPREANKCDICGGELYQRADDTPETHRRRIQVYLDQTAPLIEFYRKRRLLVEIDGEKDIQEVYAALLDSVQRAARGRWLGSCCCVECGA